jgi:hypothetical protein
LIFFLCTRVQSFDRKGKFIHLGSSRYNILLSWNLRLFDGIIHLTNHDEKRVRSPGFGHYHIGLM